MQAPTALGGLKITLPYERQDRVSFDTTMAQFEQEEARASLQFLIAFHSHEEGERVGSYP